MKAVKWISIGVGALLLLIVLAVIVVPMFVDLGHYKPEIEKRVSEAVGRPVSIGGEPEFFLFPWVGVALSDVRIGNPRDFEEENLAAVRSFEVRVKLLPLISRDIQVERFVMEGAEVVLVRNKDGEANWQGLGGAGTSQGPVPRESPETPEGDSRGGLPVESLAVGEFAVSNASLLWIDHTTGVRRHLSDIQMHLDDLSLDRPIGVDLSGRMEGKPVSVRGRVGPLGSDPSKGIIPLDLKVEAAGQLAVDMQGQITGPSTRQHFEMNVDAAPFSPRRLFDALGRPFPVDTSDPGALDSVAFRVKARGSPEEILFSDGVIALDQSKIDFSGRIADPEKPVLALDLHLDRIDLDRYLPPEQDREASGEKGDTRPESPEQGPDYGPLKRLVLDGAVRAGEVKARGAMVRDLLVKITGKNGLFNIDPFSVKLYGGGLDTEAVFDVRGDRPKTRVALQAQGIEVGPLLRDLVDKDFIEGRFKADLDLSLEGLDAGTVKRTLQGTGDLVFNDGTVKGIDLLNMIRNVQTAFGSGGAGREGAGTAYSEFHIPFTVKNGVLDTRNIRLTSPVLRVTASGKADLVGEKLDFRVEPQFVSPLQGQEATGLTVPVVVSGDFASPRFAPDLKGMIRKRAEETLKDPSKLQELLRGDSEKGDDQSTREKIDGLLKGLPFGK